MSTNQSLIPATTTDMMTVAKALAESGYFQDARQQAQAFVKVLAGSELGLPPFQAMSGIHVISGKPVLGAGLIASIIKRSGKYDYRVRETTESKCSIDFMQGSENIGNSTFTIEQARKAGVKNLDKFAQNMLFARAISNGAKWFTPDVFGGPIYTEGEIEVQDTTATVIDARATPRPSKLETATQMKEIQAEGPEAFITRRIEEFATNIERSEDAASWDWNEQLISEANELPENEKVALLKQSIIHRTGRVTTAEEAEVVKKRIAGWAKVIGTDNVTALLGDLVEQAKENGVLYENKKFSAPVEAETVETEEV